MHVTVPDEPNEMVFVPELNRFVLATAIVAFGKVTAELRVVFGPDEQYDGSVTVTEFAE